MNEIEDVAGYLKPMLDAMLPAMDTLAQAKNSKDGVPGDVSAWSAEMQGMINTFLAPPKLSISNIAGTEVSITKDELGVCVSVFDEAELDNGIFRMVL